MIEIFKTHARKEWVQTSAGIFLVAVVIIIALLPLFFGTVIYEDDVAKEYLPTFKFYSDAVKSGESFIMTPEIFSGFPLAFSQSGGFYDPINYTLFKSFSFLTAYHLRIALNYILAAAFMILFARSLKLGFIASLIAAFAYITAQHIIPGANILRSNSFFLMPGLFFVVYSLHLSVLNRKPAKSVFLVMLGILIFLLSFLGGYTQLNLYSMVAVGFWSVYLLFRSFSWRFLSSIFALFFIGGLSFLPHALNVTSLISGSFREGGLNFELASKSVSLSNYIHNLTVNLFLPSFQSGTLQSLYIGSISVFLFLLSFVFIKKNTLITFFAGLLTFSLLSAFPYPLFWLMHKLPIFDAFRFPPHWFFVSSFAMSILAALGYHNISTLSQRFNLLQFLKTLLNNPRVKFFLIFILILNFILPMRLAISQNGANAENLYKTPWVVEEIRKRSDAEPFRTYNFYPGDSQYQLFDLRFKAPRDVLQAFSREYVQPHMYPAIWGADSVRGYNNLLPRRLARVLTFLEETPIATALEPKEFSDIEEAIIRIPRQVFSLLGMMNVKYVWSAIPLPKEYLGDTILLLEKSYFSGYPIPIHLYENKKFLPRFYSPSHITVMEESENNFEAIIKTPHDFSSIGFIECSECTSQANAKQGSVAILEQATQNNSVTLKVKASDEAWLVVGNSFIPGWEASIDGMEVKIYYANYIYQGIKVPKGEHKIVFKYNYRYLPGL